MIQKVGNNSMIFEKPPVIGGFFGCRGERGTGASWAVF